MAKKAAKKAAQKTAKKTAAAKSAKKPAGKGAKATPKKGAVAAKSGSPAKGRGKAPAKVAASATSRDMSKRASSLVRFAHKMLADMAAGIPDERATAQLAGAYNHKHWTLGHMADSNQWFASLIDGQGMTLPAEWSKLFGMGSTPTDEPGRYPPIADVRAAFEASIDRLCAAIEAHTDAELSAPPAGDGAGFVHDKLDSALKTAWHYGWHLGQIASLRKGLGMPALH